MTTQQLMLSTELDIDKTVLVDNAVPVDDAAMRHCVGAFPSGVTVLTAKDEEKPVGMTISSFASVSLDPPLILQCVSKTSSSLRHYSTGSSVVVNVLGCDQERVAKTFAKKGCDRFAEVETKEDSNGIPVLNGVAAWVSGKIDSIVDAGDHVILLIEAESVGRNDKAPLLYHSGQMYDWGRPIDAAL